MRSPAPLNTHTLIRIERMFRFTDREKARQILLNWSDQRFCCNPSEAERVRFAALKVSEGELRSLNAAIELANEDYRDLLVQAGFASHPEEHQRWWPSELHNDG